MATFVIVPGGYVGGWYWTPFAPYLRDAGHTVFTPTLTGLGERAHLLTREVSLATHIADIVGVLAYEELREVILVGHSYGGMVISGVAERVPERLAHLVYLDAFVPADGQTALELFHHPEAIRATEEAVRRDGEGWFMPRPTRFSGPPDLAPWFLRLVTDQPFRTAQEPLAIGNPTAVGLPRTYIHCTEGKDPRAEPPYLAVVRTNPAWRYDELATGHHPGLSTPRELADLLLGVADFRAAKAPPD